MKLCAALVVAVVGAAAARAQAGVRNGLVYAARAVGEPTWHFGNYTLSPLSNAPTATFEIAVFADWKTGAGFAASTHKTYIDCNNTTDSIAIIDDPSNGVSPNDGRQGKFNYTAATQKVLTTRNASIPGSGFRLTGSADTAADASAGGAYFFNQSTPVGNPNFSTEDHILGYRFNLTVARPVGFGARFFYIHTPTGSGNNRVGGFTTYNSLAAGSSTDFRANLVVDAIQLTANWIPTPSALTVLAMVGALSGWRRRRVVGSSAYAF